MDPMCHYCDTFLKGRCRSQEEAEQCAGYKEKERLKNGVTLLDTVLPTGSVAVQRRGENTVIIDHAVQNYLPVVIDLDEAERMVDLLKQILEEGND